MREPELSPNNPLLKSILEDYDEKKTSSETKLPHSFDNSFLLVNDDLMFLRFLWGNQTLYSSQNSQSSPFPTKSHGTNSRSNHPLSLLKKTSSSAAACSYQTYLQLKVSQLLSYHLIQDKLRVPHPNPSKLLKSLALNSHEDRALLTRLEDRASQIFDKKSEGSNELENPIKSINIEKRRDGIIENDIMEELYRIKIEMSEDIVVEVKALESGF